MDLVLKILLGVFGGGMLGQLIIFFTKRHDTQQNRRVEFYSMVYNRLAQYYNAINEILLCFSEYSNNQIIKIQSKNLDIDNSLSTLHKINKEIKLQQRKCKKGECPDTPICQQCQQKREGIIKLYQTIETQRDEAELIIQDCNDYWNNNFIRIKQTITPYLNIQNLLMSGGNVDKSLICDIVKIDTQSLYLLFHLPEESQKIDFYKEFTAQLSLITTVLAKLSKKIQL